MKTYVDPKHWLVHVVFFNFYPPWIRIRMKNKGVWIWIRFNTDPDPQHWHWYRVPKNSFFNSCIRILHADLDRKYCRTFS